MSIQAWGIPTLLEAPGPEESAALCRELGFSFVELNMNLPEYQQWDIPRLRRVAERQGIFYTIHLDENLDVCNFNPRVADAYLETLLETIAVAKELGAPVLNMHLQWGVHFKLPDRKVYLYDSYIDRYTARLREAVARCEEASAGSGLKICVENTNGFTLPFLQEALGIFLQSPLFMLTFDIGHNYCAGDADRAFFLAHQDKLRHFHIHDGLGEKCHLPLGAGEIDLPWHLSLAAKQGCRAVLEVKTVQALRDSAAWLRVLQNKK